MIPEVGHARGLGLVRLAAMGLAALLHLLSNAGIGYPNLSYHLGPGQLGVAVFCTTIEDE